MITIYQLPPAFDLPVSVSPYCAKLELYLRLTGRPYQTKQGDIRKSPNKKVPYVEGVGPNLLADSTEIVSRLEAEGPALDEGLDDDARARGRALEAKAQDRLYFACLYSRFVEPAGWTHQKPTVQALVPRLLSPILVPIIRSSQVKLCQQNGCRDDGAYPPAISVAKEISAALEGQDYLLGDQPRVADCAVWANVMQNAFTRSDNPIRGAVRDDERLMAYVHRLADKANLKLPALA